MYNFDIYTTINGKLTWAGSVTDAPDMATVNFCANAICDNVTLLQPIR